MFKSLSHFEFVFVCGERVCPKFIVLQVAVQIPQHHLPKTFSYCLVCWRLIDGSYVGLFVGSLFCFIDPYVYFPVNIMLFWLL